jgi:NADPH2 dehydrogenase
MPVVAAINQSITINKKVLRNRIIMPPLVCFNWGDDDGFETVSRAEHYGQRARGGVALIVIEATAINKSGRIHTSELGLWSDAHIPQFRAIAEACHDAGCLVTVQLVHAGAKSAATQRYSASAGQDGEHSILELSEAQIASVVDDFVSAALRAEAAGLDGVEIHGAHGYLINQFASAVSNKRQDGYGGNEGRMRLALEVSQAVRQAVSHDFIVGYRYGINDPDLVADIELVHRLEKAGIDWFNISAGIGGDAIKVPEDFPYHFVTWMGCALQRHLSVPGACVFGITKPEQAEYLVAGGYSDLVAVGRGLLADPDWTNKALANQTVAECLHCPTGCQFRRDGRNCPVRLAAAKNGSPS